jgi:hypothetical protein
MYNGAGVQGTVAVLELAGNQGRRQSPQVTKNLLFRNLLFSNLLFSNAIERTLHVN